MAVVALSRETLMNPDLLMNIMIPHLVALSLGGNGEVCAAYGIPFHKGIKKFTLLIDIRTNRNALYFAHSSAIFWSFFDSQCRTVFYFLFKVSVLTKKNDKTLFFSFSSLSRQSNLLHYLRHHQQYQQLRALCNCKRTKLRNLGTTAFLLVNDWLHNKATSQRLGGRFTVVISQSSCNRWSDSDRPSGGCLFEVQFSSSILL